MQNLYYPSNDSVEKFKCRIEDIFQIGVNCVAAEWSLLLDTRISMLWTFASETVLKMLLCFPYWIMLRFLEWRIASNSWAIAQYMQILPYSEFNHTHRKHYTIGTCLYLIDSQTTASEIFSIITFAFVSHNLHFRPRLWKKEKLKQFSVFVRP